MNAHTTLVLALAGNANPEKADVVLSQAVEVLRLDADALCDVYQESGDNDLLSRLYYLANRLKALEEFLDCLEVGYHDDYAVWTVNDSEGSES